jgi:F-type H+-transporting ATPase subunit delta
MNKVSRRALAHWASEQIETGQSVSAIAKQVAAVLKETNRTDQVEFLLSDIVWELEQRKTLTVGKVTVAHDITDQLERALAQQIKEATKAAHVVLEKTIDKSVIGGVRVETASQVWDATVSRRLSDLKEVF